MAFCNECGATVPDNLKFCTECGSKMSAATPPPPHEGSTNNPQPAYTASQGSGNAEYDPPQPAKTQYPAAQASGSAQYAPPPQPAATRYTAAPVAAQQIKQPAPVTTAYNISSQYSVPPKGSPYAAVSTGKYLGFMILFMIPVIGWIVCILTAIKSKNHSLRNFAKAMMILLVIGIAVSVALFIFISWVWGIILEYLNETSGGLFTDYDGVLGLFNLFK